MGKYGDVTCYYCPRKRGIEVVCDSEMKIAARFTCRKHKKKAFEDVQEIIDNVEKDIQLRKSI